MLPRTFLYLLLVTILSQAPAAHAQGSSPADPAPVGTAVMSIIQLGPMNTTNYDVTITVLETVRGEAALDRLTQAAAPPAGQEYLLARIRCTLQGRAVTDIGGFELGVAPFQWVAYSSTLAQYPATAVAPPAPVLRGTVRSGETAEGWLVFAVEQAEPAPLLTFDPSAGGATGRGNLVFFKLY